MTTGAPVVFVVGGTGATGSLVVKHLHESRCRVRIVARSPEKIPAQVRDDTNVDVIAGTVLDIGAQ